MSHVAPHRPKLLFSHIERSPARDSAIVPIGAQAMRGVVGEQALSVNQPPEST